jgi:hypothetical protein
MCHISDITLTADVILDDRYYKPRQHDHLNGIWLKSQSLLIGILSHLLGILDLQGSYPL